jgi:hypothetical protein
MRLKLLGWELARKCAPAGVEWPLLIAQDWLNPGAKDNKFSVPERADRTRATSGGTLPSVIV